MNLSTLKVCPAYFRLRVNISTYLHASILTSDGREVSCCPALGRHLCCVSSLPEQPVKALRNQKQRFLFNYPYHLSQAHLNYNLSVDVAFQNSIGTLHYGNMTPQSMPQPDTGASGSSRLSYSFQVSPKGTEV